MITALHFALLTINGKTFWVQETNGNLQVKTTAEVFDLIAKSTNAREAKEIMTKIVKKEQQYTEFEIICIDLNKTR